MILTNRLFSRKPPSRDAKSIFIFCEGARREYHYFKYFKEIDSRINIEVYPLNEKEDNSPSGLFAIANNCLLKTETNPNPKYEVVDGDEIWIVLDTDIDKHESRKQQIIDLRTDCRKLGWSVALSNPCFEVWLYYHFHSYLPDFEGNNICKGWKPLLDKMGGFDHRKHPVYIQTAMVNAENNFKINGDDIEIGSTEIITLSKSILPLIKGAINEVLTKL